MIKKVTKKHSKHNCRDCGCHMKYKYETVVCFHCYLKTKNHTK